MKNPRNYNINTRIAYIRNNELYIHNVATVMWWITIISRQLIEAAEHGTGRHYACFARQSLLENLDREKRRAEIVQLLIHTSWTHEKLISSVWPHLNAASGPKDQ